MQFNISKQLLNEYICLSYVGKTDGDATLSASYALFCNPCFWLLKIVRFWMLGIELSIIIFPRVCYLFYILYYRNVSNFSRNMLLCVFFFYRVVILPCFRAKPCNLTRVTFISEVPSATCLIRPGSDGKCLDTHRDLRGASGEDLWKHQVLGAMVIPREHSVFSVPFSPCCLFSQTWAVTAETHFLQPREEGWMDSKSGRNGDF